MEGKLRTPAIFKAAAMVVGLAVAGFSPPLLSASATPVHQANAASAEDLVLSRAQDLRLVMVEERGCRYCIKWNQDVGRGYARTPEGSAAPLMRVKRDATVLKGLAPVVYTPTFILLRNGGELGRITGYPGQMYFWEELTVLLQAHGVRTGSGSGQLAPQPGNG